MLPWVAVALPHSAVWGNGIMKRERNVESYGKGAGTAESTVNSRKSPWAKSICGPFGLFWSSMLGFTMFQVRHIVKLWLAGNGEIIQKFLRNTRFSHWKFHWRGSGLWCEGALKQVEACNPKPGSYAPGETCKASSVDRTIIGSSVYLSICLYSIRIILYWWLYYIEHDLSYLY
jgi:hypothetical protein